MDPRLRKSLEHWECAQPRPLGGTEGPRRHFRVQHPSLGTALVVLYPPRAPGQEDDPYFEYRALHAYLDPVMRVPTIIQAWDEERALLVEDLGETTLERRLTSHPEEESAWAEQAGWLLGTWLGPLTLGAPRNAFFMGRSFDEPRLDYEWTLCRAHFFEGLLQKEAPRWLERFMAEVHASLQGRARFLSHREFQVRNLLVQQDRLVVIDFQDARRGAATYDLASILFDPHWDWSKEAAAVLVERVRRELGWSDHDLREELSLCALQRAFMELGAQAARLGQPGRGHAAPAIPRTLRHLRGHFQRLHHGEGVLAAENWLRQAEKRLWNPKDEAAPG